MPRGFNSWMMVEDAKLKAIGEIVQMLHNARFLHNIHSSITTLLKELQQYFPDQPVTQLVTG